MRGRVLAAIVLCVAAARADGPPEGFERLHAPGLVIDRRPRDAALAGHAAALFEAARASVEVKLGARLGEPDPRLILTANESDFAARAQELGVAPPSWALAIAVPPLRSIVIRGERLASGNDFLDPTLRHELAHLVLGAVAARSGHGMPRWLDEGLASFAEGRLLTRDEELELGAAARFGTLEAFSTIEKNFPPHAPQAERAYRMSLGFVLWLDRYPGGVRDLVARLERGATADEAIRAVAGKPAGEAEAEWALELAERSSIWESLVRSASFWWGVVGLLAVVAIVRYVLQARRLKARLDDEPESLT